MAWHKQHITAHSPSCIRTASPHPSTASSHRTPSPCRGAQGQEGADREERQEPAEKHLAGGRREERQRRTGGGGGLRCVFLSPLPSSAPSLSLSSSVQGPKRVTQSPHRTLLQTRRVSPASPSASPTGPPSNAAKRCPLVLPRSAPSLPRPSLSHTRPSLSLSPPPLPLYHACVPGGASGAAAGAAQHSLDGALRRHAAGGGTRLDRALHRDY
jgi:hypothetical protein